MYEIGRSRFLGVLLSSLVAVLVIWAGPARAGDTCGSIQEQESLRLTISAARDTYTLGSTARVTAKVTRETAGQRQAVEGAEVGLQIEIGESLLHGSAVTNSEGVAEIKVKIARWVPLGMADGLARANREWVASPICHGSVVQESGDTQRSNLFRVVG